MDRQGVRQSTAAIHCYDTKDELLVAFLDYVFDQFAGAVHEVDTIDPEQRLQLLLDKLLIPQE